MTFALYRARVEETLETPVNKRLKYHCIVDCIVRLPHFGNLFDEVTGVTRTHGAEVEPMTILLDNLISVGYNISMTPEQLKEWRARNSYTQKRLADALGVIQVTIARWETGVREIPSFLHLALRYLELEGGEPLDKGTRKRKGGKKHVRAERKKGTVKGNL